MFPSGSRKFTFLYTLFSLIMCPNYTLSFMNFGIVYIACALGTLLFQQQQEQNPTPNEKNPNPNTNPTRNFVIGNTLSFFTPTACSTFLFVLFISWTIPSIPHFPPTSFVACYATRDSIGPWVLASAVFGLETHHISAVSCLVSEILAALLSSSGGICTKSMFFSDISRMIHLLPWHRYSCVRTRQRYFKT